MSHCHILLGAPNKLSHFSPKNVTFCSHFTKICHIMSHFLKNRRVTCHIYVTFRNANVTFVVTLIRKLGEPNRM